MTNTSRVTQVPAGGHTMRVDAGASSFGATFDCWGGSWGASWGTSWQVALAASGIAELTQRITGTPSGGHTQRVAGA